MGCNRLVCGLRFAAIVAASALAVSACNTRPEGQPGSLPGFTGQTSSSIDDWPTFAHDNMRSGYNPTGTNLTPSNVPQLTLRWQQNVREEIFSSPVVYDGNLIVVTEGTGAVGSIVYDLSTTDGHVLWRFVMHSKAKSTPVIDPDAGLVIVGNEQTKRKHPSYVYALSLLDGSLVWSQPIYGLIRGPLLVANGSVYVGRAGGDPPLCEQGGITAFNEVSGYLEWTWNVDSTPKEGGSVWGAVAFDGTHLIFGTGNACQTGITTANGAVALNLDGSVAWSIVAVKNSDADADTGGGVMLLQGNAYFINKNGRFYAVNAATGNTAWVDDLNPNAQHPHWQGGSAAPSSDGNTIVVGSGLYSGTSSGSGGEFCPLTTAKPTEVFAGYHSELQGMNSSGTVLWTDTMQNRLVGYVAIVPGLGFVGLNKSFVALDLSSGTTLWSYATEYYINASMVVVPSGVYGADQGGNVYAFALPPSSR